MSLKDFGRSVVPSGILTNQESLQVYQYFAGGLIVVPDIKFPCTFREGLAVTAKLHSYCVYGSKIIILKDVVNSVDYKMSDTLQFAVEPRDVHLRGICLVINRKADEAVFKAKVCLRDENGDELPTPTWEDDYCNANWTTTRLQSKKTSQAGDYLYGFNVKFKKPVLLSRSSKYTIQVEVECTKAEQDAQLCQIDVTPTRLTDVNNTIYFKFKANSLSHHICQLWNELANFVGMNGTA